MKPLRNILFTFDYELFLGSRSGTVDKCMIEPTHLLRGIFAKHAIKHAIFFVDTTYLCRLKKENSVSCKEDFRKISQQLTSLVAEGHLVFPHIHPHWLDAVYQPGTNQWTLNNYSRYRFHHLADEEKKSVFSESVLILHEILKDTPHKINGYRAGGWSIQPFSDFKLLFETWGITHEFSVVPGFKNLSPAQYFDFSSCPAKNIYQFEEDPCVENITGKFREYTISSLHVSSFLYWKNKIWLKYLWKTGQRSIGDGAGRVIKDESVVKSKSDMLGSPDKEMICVESLNSAKLGLYRRFIDRNSYMHFISHPKMLSHHNLSAFDSFLEYATTHYELNTDHSNFIPG